MFESTNGDGESDILWLSEGSEYFVRRINLPPIAAERCSIGDLDGDGRIDILGRRAWLNQLPNINEASSLSHGQIFSHATEQRRIHG